MVLLSWECHNLLEVRSRISKNVGSQVFDTEISCLLWLPEITPNMYAHTTPHIRAQSVYITLDFRSVCVLLWWMKCDNRDVPYGTQESSSVEARLDYWRTQDHMEGVLENERPFLKQSFSWMQLCRTLQVGPEVPKKTHRIIRNVIIVC